MLAIIAAAVSFPTISRLARPPLDEKGRYNLLSNRAAHRWVDEGCLIGKNIADLRAAFGPDNVFTDDAGQSVGLNYDSSTTGSIRCTLHNGTVTSATIVVP
jgi:hypothetical protein